MSVIPIEISFIKDIKRDPTRIKEYAKKVLEALGKNSNAILFRTYGWFDYLIIFTNPKTRCALTRGSGTQFDDVWKGIMKTSFIAWYYDEGKYKRRITQIKTPYCKIIENLRSKLCSITSEKENGEKIVWDNLKVKKQGNIIEPQGLFVLSFIKLRETTSTTVSTTQVTQQKNVLRSFMIIDYLGLWDVAILAEIEDGSPHQLERYKYEFLVASDEVILQSSSVVLTSFDGGI